MKYKFNCSCGNSTIVECSMNDISKLTPICDRCGGSMKRVWKASFIIPEHMKGDNVEQMSYVNNIMKNRPSGKRKVLY